MKPLTLVTKSFKGSYRTTRELWDYIRRLNTGYKGETPAGNPDELATEMNHIYLTRRNLQTLLNKLDRPGSQCTIIKYDTSHPKYPCSTATIVTAVDDDEYYKDREPGEMHHMDV